MSRFDPEPTVTEANTEPPLPHAEVRLEGQLHKIPRRVQRQPVGRQATELSVGVTRVHHNLVIHAARRLLQFKIQEGELDDVPGWGLHFPSTGQQIGIILGVAGRREASLGLPQHRVTVCRAAAPYWKLVRSRRLNVSDAPEEQQTNTGATHKQRLPSGRLGTRKGQRLGQRQVFKTVKRPQRFERVSSGGEIRRVEED